MLDDPLSAVDAHVGKSIFDSVIGPKGMLKDKTRLFVTNSLNFLPQVDKIIMIENGALIETGTYEKLLSQNGIFTEFMRGFLEANETSQEFIMNIAETQMEENKVNIDQSVSITNAPTQKTQRKLIEKEKVESGSVKFSTIFEYLKACRLWLSFVYFLLIFLSYLAYMLSRYWLRDWSNDPLTEIDTNSTNAVISSNMSSKHTMSKFYRLSIYIALGLLNSMLELSSDFIFVYMFIKATKRLHNKMLYRVLRSDLKFFESTPTGRIINRFSKDVGATEWLIPISLQTIIDFFLSLFISIFIILTATPLIILALVPVIVLYVLVQRYFIPSNRQLKRMLSVSKSPVLSHFSESQAGVMTLRAYRLTDTFIKIMENNIDQSFRNHYAMNVSNK